MKHTINILLIIYLCLDAAASKTNMQQPLTKNKQRHRKVITTHHIAPSRAIEIIERKINEKHPVTIYIEQLKAPEIPSHLALKDFELEKDEKKVNLREVFLTYTKKFCQNNKNNCPLATFINNIGCLSLNIDQQTSLRTQIMHSNKGESASAQIKLTFVFLTQLAESKKN